MNSGNNLGLKQERNDYDCIFLTLQTLLLPPMASWSPGIWHGMPSNLAAFFTSRWRGEAPLAIIFWRDMLLASTALNVLFGVLALALYAAQAPIAVVLIVFFALFPWNVFLVIAVWRSTHHSTSSVALLTRTAAAAWLVAVTMI